MVLAGEETKWQPCLNLTLTASQPDIVLEDCWENGRLSPAVKATVPTVAAVAEAPAPIEEPAFVPQPVLAAVEEVVEAPAPVVEEPASVPEPVLAAVEEVVKKVEEVIRKADKVVAKIPAPLGNIVPGPSSSGEAKVVSSKSALSKKAARRAQAGASKTLAKGLEDK